MTTEIAGYKEKENGFSIPPLFDAKAHQSWPGIWMKFFQKNYLPVVQYLYRMDSAASIFKDGLTKIIDELANNTSEIKKELKRKYRENLYPYYTNDVKAWDN